MKAKTTIFIGVLGLFMMSCASYYKPMPEVYLLHGLWGPWRVDSWSDSNGQSGSKTTYIPIGITIGVINAIVASAANSNHKKDLNNNEIFGRTIKPNGTITGIIILNYSQYDPLDFKYLDK